MTALEGIPFPLTLASPSAVWCHGHVGITGDLMLNAAVQAAPFYALAFNSLLANCRLLNACRHLSQAEFIAPRVGFFPSLRSTLNHILVIDWFYIDALEGGSLGPAAWRNEEPCSTAEDLKVAQEVSDRRLLELTAKLRLDDLVRPIHIHREDRVQIERLDRVLLHLFQHQTHHRGQAHAMLSGTSVAPPQLDEFILADDASFRRKELAELGLAEGDLRVC